MKKPLRSYGWIGCLLLVALLASCEDVIDVQTDEAPTAIVVDAWITNLLETQTIRLTQSQPYFDDDFAAGITGALVQITSTNGQTYDFEETGGGNYEWTPTSSEDIGKLGDRYELTIEVDGAELRAFSQMNRVPVIDSISQELRTDELGPDGIYAEFFARDPIGLGDVYWIKTFKNSAFLNKPSEINLAYDAGFDAGAEIDGLIFIPPIRELANPVPDSLDTDESPYDVGDMVRVEIHSITLDAFFFIETMRDQILNGTNTIFASPIANAPTNIEVQMGDQPVLGFFCVSAVSSLEKVIK